MERKCGEYQQNLSSKSALWSNISKHMLHMAYLDQLCSCYDLEAELAVVSTWAAGGLLRGKKIFNDCEQL